VPLKCHKLRAAHRYYCGSSRGSFYPCQTSAARVAVWAALGFLTLILAATRYAIMMLRHARTASAYDKFHGKLELVDIGGIA